MVLDLIQGRSAARGGIEGNSTRRHRTRRRGFDILENRRLLSGAITVGISRRSDLDGDGTVPNPRVAVVGRTTPRSLVRLDLGGDGRFERATRANATGDYRFLVPLRVGRNELHLRATGRDGSTATADFTATRADALIAWNTAALDAIRAAGTSPPMAARDLAMVQLAAYDAVNSIDRRHEPYGGIRVRATRDASMAAAVAGAADRVLRALYPDRAAAFDATLAETMAAVHGPRRRTRGEAVGRRVGDAILALRADDGSDRVVDAPPATRPGMWAPTPPSFGRAVGLNFAFVRPFAMSSPSQFHPGPPPALDSPEYTAAYEEVQSVGAVDGTTRTPDQTEFAHFWADLPGLTFTPPGHWNRVAQDAAMSRRLGLADEARLFAVLDVALADAGISSWEAKNFYDLWRPVTAIRSGDGDGNPRTVGDADWTPLWATPAFSSYTSGHATFSAAAATVLDSFFGPGFAFTDTGDPSQHLAPRHFDGFDEAAAEAAASRLYGGIHFRFDNEVGLAVGREIGRFVLRSMPA